MHKSEPTHVTLPAFIGVLLAAGNTDDLIQWDKLANALRDAPPPLSDSERVSAILAVANGDPIDYVLWSRLVGGIAIRTSNLAPRVKVPPSTQQAAEVRKYLDAAHDGSPREVATLLQQLARDAARSVLIAPDWTGSGRVDRIITRSAAGALAFGLRLALDPNGPFREQLARCGYSECRRHFRKRRPEGGRGATVRKYCCEEHRVKGDGENARERMKQLRRKAK